jgi:hypothetical protein
MRYCIVIIYFIRNINFLYLIANFTWANHVSLTISLGNSVCSHFRFICLIDEPPFTATIFIF